MRENIPKKIQATACRKENDPSDYYTDPAINCLWDPV